VLSGSFHRRPLFDARAVAPRLQSFRSLFFDTPAIAIAQRGESLAACQVTVGFLGLVERVRVGLLAQVSGPKGRLWILVLFGPHRPVVSPVHSYARTVQNSFLSQQVMVSERAFFPPFTYGRSVGNGAVLEQDLCIPTLQC